MVLEVRKSIFRFGNFLERFIEFKKIVMFIVIVYYIGKI